MTTKDGVVVGRSMFAATWPHMATLAVTLILIGVDYGQHKAEMEEQKRVMSMQFADHQRQIDAANARMDQFLRVAQQDHDTIIALAALAGMKSNRPSTP